MTQAEIDATVKDYADAAERAIKAGFDGVEVHGANGYLIDQFLRDGSNTRDDNYGGSIENRIRFLKEVVAAVSERVGADKTGVRIAPTGAFNDMADSDPAALFTAVVEMLNGFDLGFLHVVQEFPGEEADKDALALFADLKKRWKGAYIANGGYTAERAARDIAAGKADAVTFGRPFIANPDLPKRFAFGADLNEPDQSTFYGGGREGYTDYSFLEEQLAEAL
jgi:N-ethylmaleimide reductase